MYADIVNHIQQVSNIQNLPFVERYGGLTRCVTKTVCVDEKYQVFKKITFPVTCSSDADNCYENEGYSQIIPSGEFKSIFYFEELAPMSWNKKLSESYPKAGANTFVYEGKLRLVGWLNMAMLGKEVCDSCDFAVRCLLGSGMFSIRCQNTEFGEITVYPPLVRINDPEIFRKYSYYNDIGQYMFYPCCSFAMDFNVRIVINSKCTSTEDPCNDFGDPIECINV